MAAIEAICRRTQVFRKIEVARRATAWACAPRAPERHRACKRPGARPTTGSGDGTPLYGRMRTMNVHVKRLGAMACALSLAGCASMNNTQRGAAVGAGAGGALGAVIGH